MAVDQNDMHIRSQRPHDWRKNPNDVLRKDLLAGSTEQMHHPTIGLYTTVHNRVRLYPLALQAFVRLIRREEFDYWSKAWIEFRTCYTGSEERRNMLNEAGSEGADHMASGQLLMSQWAMAMAMAIAMQTESRILCIRPGTLACVCHHAFLWGHLRTSITLGFSVLLANNRYKYRSHSPSLPVFLSLSHRSIFLPSSSSSC